MGLRDSGILGDFDGDRRPDLAVARSSGKDQYQIQIFLSAEPGTAFELSSVPPGGLHLTAKDVDGDLDLDLVITTALGRQPIGVWINDGHGHFTQRTGAADLAGIRPDVETGFTSPDAPPQQALSYLVSQAGWLFESGAASTPVLNCLRVLSPVPIDRRESHCLNAASLLRAPPLP